MADEVVLIADGKITGVGTPEEILPEILGTSLKSTCSVLSCD